MPTEPSALSLAEILGIGRLAAEGGAGVTDIVEQMHDAVLDTPGLAPVARGLTGGLTRLIYGNIRGAFTLAAQAFGAGASLVGADADDRARVRSLEVALAALNGVVGDHLARTGNPLAQQMRLRRDGRPLKLDREALAAAYPQATGKLAIFVHGLCMSDRQWMRSNHDHGAALARDLGYSPVYLSYNSGEHVSVNGGAFAATLESLASAWPIEIVDFVIVGHSMGGLVARSACVHAEKAGHHWRRALRKLVFLGTPHHGAPLERVGSWVHTMLGKAPYVAAFAPLGAIRSAGITDLRFGNLVEEDWQGRDRFTREPDSRRVIPLPEGVVCYAMAATTAASPDSIEGRLVGDGLVQVASALGRHENPARDLGFPPEHCWIATETGHLELLSRRAVYTQIANWLA